MWKGCWLAAFAGALPLWSIACGDGKLRSDDFDQSCEVDDNCVVVVEIGFCCSCEGVAINSDELADYEAAAGCGTCGLACADQLVARCIAGRCEAKPKLLCAPGEDYDCKNDECPDYTGTMECDADGLGYSDCVCG